MYNIYKYLFSLVLISALGCASTPATEVKKDTSDPNVAVISSQNQQLANNSIGGFAYKSSKLDTARWDRWAKNTAPVVKEIISKLPEGYVLQVTGHTDASGPEEPTGEKPGNIKISTDRAKTVYDALKRANIDSPKMTYKGIGSDELMKGYDPKAPEQRRVTFKVVPK